MAAPSVTGMRLLNELLGGLPPWLALGVVTMLVTSETAFVVGLVLPAATALIALGLLAGAGVVPIGPALIVGVVASISGGTAAFHSGRRRGPAVRRRIGDRRWGRAERLFARHGGRAVFLGHWIVGARTLMPRLAAMNGIGYRRFAAWHTPAATSWALWMVGSGYLAGESYDLFAARVGHAGAAVAAFAALIAVLILAGRRLGALDLRPSAALVNLALATVALFALAGLLVLVVPGVVRFSGLADADAAIAAWARSEWTSDGYLFALRTAAAASPAPPFVIALVVSLVRWRRQRAAGLLTAIGPVLPIVVLAAALTPGTWRAPSSVVLPAPGEFDQHVSVASAAIAAGHTAQIAAAAGLLAWLLAGWLPRSWQVALWVVAAGYVLTCAGSWIYLGWSRPSETVAAVLVGAAWATLNAAIWSVPNPHCNRAAGLSHPAGVKSSGPPSPVR